MRRHHGVEIVALLYAGSAAVMVVASIVPTDVFMMLREDERTPSNLFWSYMPYGLVQLAITGLLLSARNAGRIAAICIIGGLAALEAVAVAYGDVLSILWLVLDAAAIAYLCTRGVAVHFKGEKAIAR